MLIDDKNIVHDNIKRYEYGHAGHAVVIIPRCIKCKKHLEKATIGISDNRRLSKARYLNEVTFNMLDIVSDIRFRCLKCLKFYETSRKDIDKLEGLNKKQISYRKED